MMGGQRCHPAVEQLQMACCGKIQSNLLADAGDKAGRSCVLDALARCVPGHSPNPVPGLGLSRLSHSSCWLTGQLVRISRCYLSARSEEHTSELQSLTNLVCRLLLEK